MPNQGKSGGYRVFLVEKPDHRHLCAYCKLLLRTPVQTPCGHRLCSSCQKQLLAESGRKWFSCPECQEVIAEVYPDKFAGREVGCLQTKCGYTKCPWVGEVRNFEDHKQNCQYAEVQCPNAGCSEMISVAEIEKHKANKCKYRPQQCPQCNEQVPYIELAESHKDVCPKELVLCPNECGTAPFSRDQLEGHVKECPNRECCCPYKFAGCSFKGMLESVQRHLSDEITLHVEMAAKECFQLQQNLAYMEDKSNKASQTVDHLSEKVRILEEQCKKDKTSMEDLQKQRNALLSDTAAIKDRLQAMALQIEETGSVSYGNLASELQSLREMASSTEERASKLRQSYQDELAKVDSIGQTQAQPQAQAQRGGFSLQPFGNLFESLTVSNERRLESIDSQLTMQDVQIAEINLKLQLLEVTSYNGSMIWKIDNVVRRRNEAMRGKTPSLYSPPFFVGRFGYKACARIYLNGDGMGKGKFVSLFFTLMKGEYDALLPWPFQQKVTFKLMDTKGRKHVSETFRPDPNSSSFRRPKSDMNLASGCPQFVEQEVVFSENSPFIDRNAIFIEITVDTAGFSTD